MKENKIYVVGTNVNKSYSPIIFNYWFEKYKIKAKYEYKQIKEDCFSQEIKKTLKEEGLCGLNITIPFKERIVKYLYATDKHSKSIGAVNCVTKTDRGFFGTNTDWLGFEESIKWHEKKNLIKIEKMETAIVIGYGGSAKAVIYSLSKMGFKKILVFNRTYEKIANQSHITPHNLHDLNQHLDSGDLIVNTIQQNYQELGLNLSTFTGYGFDLVYNYNTLFFDYILNNKRIKGYHMLIHQAVPCFLRWFGFKPEVDSKLVGLLDKKSIETDT